MSGNYCQSCAMPMEGKDNLFGTNSEETGELYGTNSDGTKNKEYCKYCYENGKFTYECTMNEMLEFCIPHMTKQGMSEDEARKIMNNCLPNLKRWKKD